MSILNSISSLQRIISLVRKKVKGYSLRTKGLNRNICRQRRVRSVAVLQFFTSETVRSRFPQKELGRELYKPESAETALFESAPKQSTPSQFPNLFCSHCRQNGPTEDCCLEKYPTLKPKRYEIRPNQSTGNAFLKSVSPKTENDSEESDLVCFIVKKGAQRESFGLGLPCASSQMFIDSGTLSHLTLIKSAFSRLNLKKPFHVRMGEKFTLQVAGRGFVSFFI